MIGKIGETLLPTPGKLPHLMSPIEQFFRALVAYSPSIGPLLSGFSLLGAAIAAWTTYLFYQRRGVEAAWIDIYRDRYAEFWKDKDVAKIRNWITNDNEYAEVENTLTERLSKTENKLTREQNETLEYIDKFCALLVRIQFFDRKNLSKHQQAMWNLTYGDFWVERITQRTMPVSLYTRILERS